VAAERRTDVEKRARQLAVVEAVPDIRRPLRLESLGPDALGACDALLVPGGLAQLVDLPASEAMGRVLLGFHGRGAPTFAIGHGPAALLSTAPGGAFPYAGYELTCFQSRLEHLLEFPLPVLRGRLRWHLDRRLASAGARLRHAAIPGVPFLVEDRELLTAQDLFAAQAFANRIGTLLGGRNA
jgi:putative intracellular protease/amidase